MAHAPVGMILCAGLGSRLSELTQVWPKPAMELLHKPIVYYHIKKLEKMGIRDIFINLSYKAGILSRVINNISTSCRINIIHEKKILGTAGAVKNIIQKFGLKNRSMILLHGDIWCEDSWSYQELRAENNFVGLLGIANYQEQEYQGGLGVNLGEKIVKLGSYFSSQEPDCEGFFSGIHYLSSQALHKLEQEKASCLVSEIYPKWLSQGYYINGLIKNLKYEDLGTPERLWRANMMLVRENKSKNSNNFLCLNNTSDLISSQNLDACLHARGENLKLAANIKFNGPCVFGHNICIESGAQITNSVVMSGTVIKKNEILFRVIALKHVRMQIGGTQYEKNWS